MNHAHKHHQHESDQKDYYTCPMHPEIKEDKPGKCPKCGGMDLVKKSELDDGEIHHDHSSMMASPKVASDFLRRFFIVTALLVPLIFLTSAVTTFLGMGDFALRPYIQLAVATIIFYFGLVFFEHARHEIMLKQYGMMTLVSLAVGAGYLFSAASTFIPALQAEFYLEISTLIWVLLFGHYLEAKSSGAAGDALQEVAKLLPQSAHLVKNNKTTDVPVSDLKISDIVLVKPGEKVPADGKIIKGEASVDEAVITGESKPVSKTKGDEAIAGSIAIDGSIYVQIDRVGENSTVGQIKQLVAQAQKTKPRTQLLADKAASWLTASALIVAILTMLIWFLVLGQTFSFALTLAITVLVIACPHALGLAIPTVTTITTKLAIQHGLFIKDLGKLEVIKDLDYIMMDKTGTLTTGEFGVTGVETLNDESKDGILKIAASLESHSSHVIGLSIVKFAQNSKLKFPIATNFKNIAGQGIWGQIKGKKYFVGNKALMENNGLWSEKADELSDRFSEEGKTVVFVADDETVFGGLLLSDTIKDESKNAIADLHRLGIKTAMVTGDNESVAKSVAKELGIDTYFANVLPEDKYKKLKSLQEKNYTVMMVGDGVNDAPALTQADIGVAIGAGTDVAVESGDVVLTRSNPQDIVSLVVLGRKTYRKMVENLVWAVGYNVLAIPAAAGLFASFGFFLSPGLGAFLMSLSSVIVVINAFKLKNASLEVK